MTAPTEGEVLVIGSTGQIGFEIVQHARLRGLSCVGPAHRDLDLASAASIHAGIATTPARLVVNVGAYTAVDRAEREPERAFAVNGQGVAELASACARRGLPLVQFSTDYVFDGARASPWRESDGPNPISVYGASKMAGEHAVRTIVARHVVIRTSGVFSARGRNFPKAILDRALRGESLRVVRDQTVCPTWAADVAEAAVTLMQRYFADGALVWGTYHYCGRGETSWDGFARELLACYRALGGDSDDPQPVSSAEFAAAARRPPYSVLDCSRIEAQYGIRPRDWRDRLPALVAGIVEGAHRESGA